MKSKKFLIIMILALLNYSINCRGNNITGFPLRGSELSDSSKVLIDIETIKAANVKLIERNYLLEEMIIKDSLLISYKQLNDVQNKELNEYKINYDNIYKFNEHLVNKNLEINKDVKTYKTTTVIFGSISLAMTFTLLLYIFVK